MSALTFEEGFAENCRRGARDFDSDIVASAPPQGEGRFAGIVSLGRRKPLIAAASRLRLLGWASALMIAATVGAMVTLAANAALAANAQVIAVLRLVGATDAYIARAFVRRFTLRALSGAAAGTVLGIGAVLLMPPAGETAGFLTGLGFRGWHWVVPLLVPPLAAAVAFVATAVAARRVLGGLS